MKCLEPLSRPEPFCFAITAKSSGKTVSLYNRIMHRGFSGKGLDVVELN